MTGIELCPEQEAGYTTIVGGTRRLAVLTGGAGTGKSQLIRALKQRAGVVLTATTGMAAMNIGGCTLDSFFAIDRRNRTFFSRGVFEWRMANSPEIILVDEFSMVDSFMFDLMYEAVEHHGKKIVGVGDWGQAKPVDAPWITESENFKDYDVVALKQCHRQSEGPYLECLNRLRLGEYTPEDEALLLSRVVREPPVEGEGLRLFATNKLNHDYNHFRLYRHAAETKSPLFRLNADFTDLRHPAKARANPRKPAFIEKAISDSRLAHDQDFAVGCRVVMTVNFPALGYVNGDTGVIIGGRTTGNKDLAQVLADGLPHAVDFLEVRLDRTEAVVRVGKLTRQMGDGQQPSHEVEGWPMDLGYSCTIHKAQGMSVHKAWVHMDSICQFPRDGRHGLAYVALSRTRTLEGLTISGWRPDAVYSDPEIRHLIL